MLLNFFNGAKVVINSSNEAKNKSNIFYYISFCYNLLKMNETKMGNYQIILSSRNEKVPLRDNYLNATSGKDL